MKAHEGAARADELRQEQAMTQDYLELAIALGSIALAISMVLRESAAQKVLTQAHARASREKAHS